MDSGTPHTSHASSPGVTPSPSRTYRPCALVDFDARATHPPSLSQMYGPCTLARRPLFVGQRPGLVVHMHTRTHARRQTIPVESMPHMCRTRRRQCVVGRSTHTCTHAPQQQCTHAHTHANDAS